MKKLSTGLIVALSTVLLLGCSPQTADTGSESGADASVSAEPAETHEDGAGSASSELFSIAHITSCDQVAAAVAPYIEGLAPLETNVVDEWGISCSWEAAEDETDFANNRSVEVGMMALEPDSEKPDPAFVEAMDGGSLVEDGWVESAGGVAYTLDMATAVVGVSVTTVWLPGIEAHVTGGKWEGMPALDGPAALEVVKSLVTQ